MPEQAAASELILRTKVQAPHLRPRWVARPGILARLMDAEWQKLTLVCAPAGFGKTTLLSLWAASSTSAFAWLTLDERDNAPERFLRYLIAAVQRTASQVGQSAEAILDSPQPVHPEQILASLINDFTEQPSKTILVLDDFHAIQSPAVIESVQYLLDNLPEPLHVVIASRADPSLALARLRARGELTELRGDDLRFSIQESTDFFTQVMGVELTPDEIEALTSRTEGWIAGLQLAALSLHDRKDSSRLVKMIAGSRRYILDYLMEEVLHQQPADVQEFLLKTSILEKLTDGLCAAVTGRSDSQEMLEKLEQANLFILPLDDERCWYRYHTLFLDLLRYRLEQSHPKEITDLHRRAAAWYEANHLAVEAVAQWTAAKDLKRASKLVEAAAGDLIARGRANQMVGWFDSLPSELFQAHPKLHLIYAWGMISLSQFSAVEPRLQDLERLLLAKTDLTSEVAQEIGSEIVATRAIIAFTAGDIQRAFDLAQQALRELPEDHMIRTSVLIGLGVAYRMSGDSFKAAEALSQAVELSRRFGMNAVSISALGSLGDIRLEQGRLKDAQSIYQEALDLIGKGSERSSPPAAQAYQGLANISYEKNQLDAAAEILSETERLVEQWGNIDYKVAVLARKATIQLANGEAEQSQASMQKMLETAENTTVNPLIQSNLTSMQLRLWMRMGRLDRAWTWIQSHPMAPYAPFAYAFQPECLAREEALILQGHAYNDRACMDEARSLLAQVEPVIANSGYDCLKFECWLLQAMERFAADELEEALEITARLVEAAQPEGFTRLFLDKGAVVFELLKALIGSKHRASLSQAAQAYLDNLIGEFDKEGSTRSAEEPAALPPNAGENPHRLSDREMEVLRLVAAGLSNQEIAERLFLAEGTIKRHVHNIFDKLDATSRAQAIVRGREQGII